MEHLAGQYFLNSDLRAEEIREQIALLCDAGYEAIFLHARAGLKTPYFSQEWFDALKVAIDELIRHGVKFAIWDEDNFPSGDGANRICNNYPEFSSSYLNFIITEAKAGEPTTIFFSVNGAFKGCHAVYEDGTLRDLGAHCGTLREKWTNRGWVQTSAYSRAGQLTYPHRRRGMNTPRFALSWTPDRDCRIVCTEWIHNGAGQHSSDLLNPEMARTLLGMIHSEYERHFPEQMKHCAAAFMDEPSPYGSFPWTRRFPEEFSREHGYDLQGLLPHLALNIDARSPRIRNDYRKTLHRLLCQGYLEPVKAWLNARGIASSGHLSRSEYLELVGIHWPNELRCFNSFDIPCCDPLGAGVGQPGSAAYAIGIKVVSSAARLFGKKAAGADAFAVGGDTVSLSDLMFMLNFHLVMGITWYNVHGLYYTLDGERRDEAPPSLFYQHSQWPHMKTFLDYLKKRCNELSGEHVCNLELLYPSTTLQTRLPAEPSSDEILHRLADSLVCHQRDFELIDEQTLLEQEPSEFVALRPYFVVAHASRIERSTAEWLERYVASGGTLFVEGVTPEILSEPDKATSETWAFADSCREPDFWKKIPAPEVTGEHSENILIRRIRKENGTRLFLFNRGSDTFQGTLDGTPIEIAPGAAGFEDELRVKDASARLPLPAWKLTFGLNSVPLYYWEFSHQDAYDLIAKKDVGLHPVPETGEYHAVFTIEGGSLGQLFFTTEEDALRNATFSLNGVPLDNFKKADFRDTRELECEVTSLLKPGRNFLHCSGALMQNAPYLRGRFKVVHPLGNNGYPVLSPAPESFLLSHPLDYRSLGYGTFSGTARYDGNISVSKEGRYTLALPILKDSVRISIDGKEVGTIIAPPYQMEVELAPGEHSITLEVCNAPGNRDILAGVPAGLQP